MSEDIIRPGDTTAEIVIKIGNQAKIMVEVDETTDGPPCLCILGNGVQLMLYPQGWLEFGEVQQRDLDRASDLVIDATRYRDAIFRKLKQQQAGEAI